ncbi:MAG: response regulator [Desulfobacterales bacterium]|nr:response regulator [Desulfobacterales bacterium]
MNSKPRILIVDDDPMNLVMIEAKILSLGYDVMIARDGLEGLKKVSESHPDVVLLDILMPKMDGFEVAWRLKNDKRTRMIPIIVITSLNDRDDRVKALEAGVDDFLTKPVDTSELQARIKSLLKIKDYYEQMLLYQRELESLNVQLVESFERANTMAVQAEIERIEKSKIADEMEKLANERAEQLIHADRMATLGTLSAGIAHEVNNPLTFISGNIQTLEKFWPILDNYLKTCPNNYPEYPKIQLIKVDIPDIIKGIRNGVSRVSRIVNGLRSFSRQNCTKAVLFNLHDAIEEALILCQNALKYKIQVVKDFDANLPYISGDQQQIEQVFVNLFSNAAHAMETKDQGTLTITSRSHNNQIIIHVADTGHGIDKKTIEKIWNPFFTTKPVGKGTGLGLSISLGIIQSHGGTISVKPNPIGGTIFELILPVKPIS